MTAQPDVVEHIDVQHRPLNAEEIAEIRARVAQLVTEDDAPVDNVFSEKQQRLLTEPLYSSWSGPGDQRPFVAMANVGLFFGINRPPLVPDMMLSADVTFPDELWQKHHRSYFVWEYGKIPEIVVEVVSNTEGGELSDKLTKYAMGGVLYYVVFDPELHLKQGVLHVRKLQGRTYIEMPEYWFPEIGLGLTLWNGAYEGVSAEWLRWCYQDRSLVLTGAELSERAQQQAQQERERAEHAQQQAEHAQQQAQQERERAERLLAQLRALGIEPEDRS
jgi:Uma2 family endonuclease